MPAPRDITSLSHEELLVLVVSQMQQIEKLEKMIEDLQKEGKRQATPFSKGTRKNNPKKPGRKKGQGPFVQRAAPDPAEITEPVVDVPIAEDVIACPECGGELGSVHEEMAYNTDLPKRIRPTVTAYKVSVCHCTKCGKSVRGQHPDVAPDQYGASAHRLGHGLLAAATLLRFVAGVTQRKIPLVLQIFLGTAVSQSTLSQDLLRRCAPPVEPADIPTEPAAAPTEPDNRGGALFVASEQLKNDIATADVVHTDDTGWRINGNNAHLMGFMNKETSHFQIRPRHRNEEVREVIPPDFDGTLCTDRGRSYDAREMLGIKQQKCLSHILRSLSEAEERQAGRHFHRHWKELASQGSIVNTEIVEARVKEDLKAGYCARLKGIFRESIDLRWKYGNGMAPDFTEQVEKIVEKLTQELNRNDLSDPDDRRLCKELTRHHQRGNLLRFLNDPQLEPTNNLAERGLRPAVIARKVSQCSKNDAGADSYARVMGIVQSLHKRTPNLMLESLTEVFRSGTMPPVPSRASV